PRHDRARSGDSLTPTHQEASMRVVIAMALILFGVLKAEAEVVTVVTNGSLPPAAPNSFVDLPAIDVSRFTEVMLHGAIPLDGPGLVVSVFFSPTPGLVGDTSNKTQSI